MSIQRVAIIMRSKDEMPYVRPALAMLQRQTFQDSDLFAVDSGSRDGSIDVIREFCRPDQIVEIKPEDYVPGRVLNDMIARTDHGIIVFQNADSIPLSEDWLERLVRPILEGAADATMSRQEPRADARFIVKYDYSRAYNPNNIKGDNADFFSAVACGFRRDLWESHKFRTHGYAEDVAWANACRRDGARFMLVQESAVEHSHNYSLKGLNRKKFRHGITFAEIYGRVPNLFESVYRCARELIRDLLHAVLKFRLDTIPYNIVYRIVIHRALYMGLKAGREEFGDTGKYDQLDKPQ